MTDENYLTDITDIRNGIINFRNDPNVQNLQSLYFSKSFSEILTVNRRENSHSSFIAWLLNEKESHLLSFFTIEKLLEIILFKCPSNIENKYPDFFNSFLIGDYSIASIEVEKEKDLSEFGRLDIFVEIQFVMNKTEITVRLIIENKVECKENGDQTARYFKHFEKIKKPNDINLYVYLTALSTLELKRLTESQCICKEFIQINYQYLVDYLIEPALNQNISDRTKFILKEYLQALSQPSLDEESMKFKQSLIMALGKEEKELLSNFWKKNEKLILSAMYAISTDESQDEDVRETTKNTLNVLTANNRDYSTISLYFDGIIFESNFKKSDIGYFTVKLLDEKKLIDEDLLSFLRADKSCHFQLIKQSEEITWVENKKYRVNNPAELFYNGKKYFVARNWGKVNGIDNTINFIKKITSKIPKITYDRNN